MRQILILIGLTFIIGCSSKPNITPYDNENLYMQKLWFNEKLWDAPHNSPELQTRDYMRCMSDANQFEHNYSLKTGAIEENQNDNMRANVELCMLNNGYTPKNNDQVLMCDQWQYHELPVCVVARQMRNRFLVQTVQKNS